MPNKALESNACPCGGNYRELLGPALDHGREIMKPEAASQVRADVMQQVGNVEL